MRPLLTAFILVSGTAPASPPAPANPFGDEEPLPLGAKVRLGTLRYSLPGNWQRADLSPDGRQIIVSHYTGCTAFDLTTGRRIREHLQIAGGGDTALCAVRGNRLIVVDPRGIRIHDWESGKVLTNYTGEPFNRKGGTQPNKPFVSADGRSVVMGHLDKWEGSWPGRVWIFDLTGAAVKARPIEVPAQHHTWGVLSPDSKTLATGGHGYWPDLGDDPDTLKPRGCLVQLWDVATGREKGRFFSDAFRCFTPDSKQVLTGLEDFRAMRVWDADTGKLVGPFAMVGNYDTHVAISPDGKAVAAGNGTTGEVQLWDLRNRTYTATYPPPEESTKFEYVRLTGLTLHPDGRFVAVGWWDGLFVMWDPVAGKMLTKIENPRQSVTAIRFSADGRTIDTLGYAFEVTHWDAQTGRRLGTDPLGVPADKRKEWKGGAYGITHSADFTILANSRAAPAGVEVLHTRERRSVGPIPVRVPGGWPPRPVLSPDGRWLAAAELPPQAGGKGDILLVSTATGRPPAGVHVPCDLQGQYAFSPDSDRLISCHYARSIDRSRIEDVRIAGWDFATWRAIPAQSTGILGTLWNIAVSPDNRTVAILHDNVPPKPGTHWLTLWDVVAGKKVHALQINSTHTDLVFSPDGRLLAYAGTLKDNPYVGVVHVLETA